MKKRFLKLLLCFFIIIGLLNSTNTPAKSFIISGAVASVATEIIGSILVAGGGYFVASGDAYQVASNIYKKLSRSDADAYEKITNMASTILSMGGLHGISTVFRLSDDLFYSISDTLDAFFEEDTSTPVNAGDYASIYSHKFMHYFYDTGSFEMYEDFFRYSYDGMLFPSLSTIVYDVADSSSNISITHNYLFYLSGCTECSDYCYNIYCKDLNSGKVLGIASTLSLGDSTHRYNPDIRNSLHLKANSLDELNNIIEGGIGLKFNTFSVGISSGKDYKMVDYSLLNCYGNIIGDYKLFCGKYSSDYYSSYGYSTVPSMYYPGTLTYPGEGLVIQAPDIPNDIPDDGFVDLPPLVLNPQDIVGDIPEDKLQDIVFDTPLPADEVGAEIGTGTLPDVDTGEGDGTLPENPPATDDIGGILDILKDFFDSPSDFDLNFDAFKNIILLDRFPFCIPFDFINSVKAFNIPAQNLQLTIAFDTKFLDVNHTVDLSPYQVPIRFFRATASLWFAVILILKTRDLIKW